MASVYFVYMIVIPRRSIGQRSQFFKHDWKKGKGGVKMGCFGNTFGGNDSCLWIIILIIILFCCCGNDNNNGCGCGC